MPMESLSIEATRDRLLESIWMPANSTKKKAETKTALRANALSRNLPYEMERAGLNPDTLLAAMRNDGQQIEPITIERWLAGSAGNITRKYRDSLARIFGYADPNSILKETHIPFRTADPPKTTDPSTGFTSLLESMSTARKSSDEATIETVQRLLQNPEMRAYVKIAASWLDQHR